MVRCGKWQEATSSRCDLLLIVSQMQSPHYHHLCCYFGCHSQHRCVSLYCVSLGNDINLLEVITSLHGEIKVLLHKSLKLHFSATLSSGRLLPTPALINSHRSPCNLYLIPACRYVGSTVFECDNKNNRVRVQSDKADSLLL